MNIRRCLRKTLKFFLCTIHSKDVAWIFFIFILITIPGISLCQHHQSTEFMDIQFNYTYTAGDLATLYCRIKDLGTKVVVWRRTSQPHPITVGLDIYIPDDRYHVQHIPYRGSWNLMIKNVNVNDAGVYECQISAKERAGSRRLVLLNVLEPPSTTTQKTMSPPARSVNSKRGTDSEERVVKSQESSASSLLVSFPGRLHLLFYFVVYYCGRT
eukprot:XP_019924805.1 PREDICTED: uncharacterized protein LOC105333098 isoform X2 [Crassostrea gigas]